MSLNRREFMQVLAVAAAAGMPIATREAEALFLQRRSRGIQATEVAASFVS